MGPLEDRVKLNMKVFGGTLPNFYKENSNFMFFKYKESYELCPIIQKNQMTPGRFYFITYMDSSNWMQFSPIFLVEHKKIGNLILLIGVNFNFIPLELRSKIFDDFIKEEDFEEDKQLPVDFKGMYTQLLKFGFEYSLVEYNVSQIMTVNQIHLELLPRFLYSSHPKNKYDPNKLMEIWTKKIETKEKRHKEITLSLLNEFVDIGNELNEKYDVLTEHIMRLRKSIEKFGG